MQLLHTLTEIGDPLEHSEARRHCVATPAQRDNAWQENEERVRGEEDISVCVCSQLQTFGKVTDKGAEIVSLLLLGLAHLHHVSQVTPYVHQETVASVHLREWEREGSRVDTI